MEQGRADELETSPYCDCYQLSLAPALPPSVDLAGFVDTAHAVDTKTQCSITGLVFCLAGGGITYKSKLQPTVAMSSLECELVATVHAAKIAKYL